MDSEGGGRDRCGEQRRGEMGKSRPCLWSKADLVAGEEEKETLIERR